MVEERYANKTMLFPQSLLPYPKHEIEQALKEQLEFFSALKRLKQNQQEIVLRRFSKGMGVKYHNTEQLIAHIESVTENCLLHLKDFVPDEEYRKLPDLSDWENASEEDIIKMASAWAEKHKDDLRKRLEKIRATKRKTA